MCVVCADHNTAAHLFGSAERKMHVNTHKNYYQIEITKMFQAILRFQYVIFDDAQIVVVQREFLESCQRRQIVLADLRYLCVVGSRLQCRKIRNKTKAKEKLLSEKFMRLLKFPQHS